MRAPLNVDVSFTSLHVHAQLERDKRQNHCAPVGCETPASLLRTRANMRVSTLGYSNMYFNVAK